MDKNADNPPELVSGTLERLCSFSRFFVSMLRNADFLLFSFAFNGMLGLAELTAEVEARDALLGEEAISGLGDG